MRAQSKLKAGFAAGCAALLATAALFAVQAGAAGPPLVKSTYVSGVGTEAATLNALFDPSSAPTSCGFEYGTDETYGQEVPCPSSARTEETLKVVATGGEFRLKLGPDATADLPFDASAAEVRSALEALPGLAGVQSLGVEGGPGDDNGNHPYLVSYSTPLPGLEPLKAENGATPLSGGSGATVSAQLHLSSQTGSLQPGTTYHYRVNATNAGGAVQGPDQVLHTFALPGEEPDSCANAATRSEQHSAFLPDCRAYEMASPSDKNGIDVMVESSMTRAAASESPGLPAAVTFAALGGFGDVHGTGVATEYMAQRDGVAGTSGWATHGITPAQKPMTFESDGLGLTSGYDGDMSPDLTAGLFRAWTPLTAAPNVASVENLYVREDLRSSGSGAYRLQTDSLAPQPAPNPGSVEPDPPFFATATPNLQHVLFESKRNLTADAHGSYPKLYKTDGSTTRLVDAGPACPSGTKGPGPCSIAGLGAIAQHYTQRTISADGSRVEFTSPVTNGGNQTAQSGAVSRLFQLDDRGTPTTADDATIQLNASEKPIPALTQAALFQTASTDGGRVFFFDDEQLTAKSGGGLYMWARSEEDETQQLSVDATAGTFTLTAHTQPTRGRGDLTAGSDEITNVSVGSFMPGQTVSAPGIPAHTFIESISGSTLTLSDPATATAAGATIAADVEATTSPLPFDASASEVQSALEALTDQATTGETIRPLIGQGNVEVSGGSGGTYELTFTGALTGVDVLPLSVDGSGLSGGAGAAVTVTNPVHNLTLLVSLATVSSPSGSTGVIGASEDGHRLYFQAAGSQLVSGGPPVGQDGIYYWQDADGTPGGTLSFIGEDQLADLASASNYSLWVINPKPSRVTPDGTSLLFETSDGSGLAPGYEQLSCHDKVSINPNNNNTGGCSEVYVYRADGSTPAEPNLICASCDPSGELPTGSAFVNVRKEAGAGNFSTHLSHALSDDGRYVFFSSPDPLVPADTNGAFDAYEYDMQTGQIHLLSSGTSASNSYFLDASADGHDAYIITRQRLLGWDVDNAYDIYDVRSGGGFPEPPATTAPCAGETCLPAIPPVGSAAPVGSVGEGPGNPNSTRPRCPKGKHAVKSRSKTRCVAKKHHNSHKPSAGANRGGRK